MADFNFDNQVSNNEGGILAAMWRKILKERNFIPALPVLIDRYQKAQDAKESAIGRNIKKKNRSTLITNLNAQEMTFKVFYDLLVNLLRVKKIVLHVEIETINSVSSVHSLTVMGYTDTLDSETSNINDSSQKPKQEISNDSGNNQKDSTRDSNVNNLSVGDNS